MTTATRTGQNPVNYKYDALGRMLYRGESNGTTVTVNYWLGLALLAQEQWGSESGRNLAIFQPWIEAHAGPTGDGWYVYGGSGTKTLEYATDAGRGEVIHITTTGGGALDGQFIVGDKNGSNYNPNATDWSNANRKHLAFWVKNANSSNHFQFTVYCRFSSGDNILLFDSGTGSDASSAGTSTFYLGSAYSTLNDGGWHYVELDLQARQRIFSGSGSLNDVDGLRFDCKNLYLDDPFLSGSLLKRSFAIIPGELNGGVIGSETGPNAPVDNAIRSRYFHYNDLGSVLAQTMADGSVEGAWEPDFNGNYANRHALSGSQIRPEIGLTGQFFDTAANGYLFRRRIFDSERGRWLSREPSGVDGPNLYGFLFASTNNFFDPTGLKVEHPGDRPVPVDPDNPTSAERRLIHSWESRMKKWLQEKSRLAEKTKGAGRQIKPGGGRRGFICNEEIPGGPLLLVDLGILAIQIELLNAEANDIRSDANDMANENADNDWRDCDEHCKEKTASFDYNAPGYSIEIPAPLPSAVYRYCMQHCGRAAGTF